jgi:hypothetical protein
VRFEGVSEQFGGVSGLDGSTRVGLGARFTFDSLGAARLPIVGRTLAPLRDSVGVDVGLTLGAVTTDARALAMRVPLRLDVGVTRRIALGLTVPLVRARQSVRLVTNAGGATGNLGFNPANATASGTPNATAQQRNAAVQQQIAAASRRLDSLVANCPATAGTNTPADCVPVIANRQGATQLARQARTVASGLAQIYGAGTATSSGALLVPIQGTDAQRAVEARLQALGAQFAAFRVTELRTPALPAGATARIANAGLQRVLTEREFGILADSVRGIERAGLGDVEIGGSVMWLDTFGATGAPAAGLRARSTVSAGYRLPTGTVATPYILFDVPLGDGPALLLSSATDLSLGRRFWVSAIARVESPQSQRRLVSVPPFAGELLASVGRVGIVDRTGGRQVALELTPRWVPNDAFAVAAHYALRSKQEDRHVGTIASGDTEGGAPVTYDAALLDAGTGGRAQSVGVGITYSTLAAYARRKTWLPVEVSYLHTSTVAGSGGVVPKVRTDQLVVRVYAQLLGRGSRRAATPTAAAPAR